MKNAATRGQPRALAAIAAMVRGRAPHAVLLVGPGSSGKTTLALDLAAGLLCHDPDPAARPCRDCRGCRLVASGNHPDLHRLAPGGRRAARSASARPTDPEPGTVRHLIGELALLLRRGRGARRHRRAGPPHQRRRPERAPQDARGAAAGRDDRPLRRRRGVPPADGSIALRPGPAGAGRRARDRALAGRARRGRRALGSPVRPTRRRTARAWPSPTPAPPTRTGCAARSPGACSTCWRPAGTTRLASVRELMTVGRGARRGAGRRRRERHRPDGRLGRAPAAAGSEGHGRPAAATTPARRRRGREPPTPTPRPDAAAPKLSASDRRAAAARSDRHLGIGRRGISPSRGLGGRRQVRDPELLDELAAVAPDGPGRRAAGLPGPARRRSSRRSTRTSTPSWPSTCWRWPGRDVEPGRRPADRHRPARRPAR